MQPLNILFLNVRKSLCSWNIRLLSFLTRCSPAAALLLLLSGHTTSNWKCSWLQVLPLTSPQSLMKPISSNRGVLACIISTPFFLRLLPCYLITDRIHLWSSSFFFLVFFLPFLETLLPGLCYSMQINTHNGVCCLNARFLSCQEATSSAQQLGLWQIQHKLTLQDPLS